MEQLKIVDGADGAGATVILDKRVAPSKRWSFTFNSYTEVEIDTLVRDIDKYCKVGFFSKEVGETGNQHLQGYIEFKTRRRPSSVLSERIHFEKSKENLQQNLEYCTKEADLTYRKGVPRTPRIYSYIDLYPAQRAVIDYLKTEPDERSIAVVHAGYNCGKTSLARHICFHLEGVILPGTKRHALSVARSFDTDIYVFDLTAEESSDCPTEFFETLESLKNGLYCSAFGTKGTGMVLRANPHIVIFSNYPSHGWCTDMDKSRFVNFSLQQSPIFDVTPA